MLYSPYLDDFQYKIAEYEGLLAYSKKYSGVYRGIFNLINYKSGGIRDWNNNDKIIWYNHNLDEHHIFPSKYLQDKKFEQEMIDCVLNRALIPKTTNIKYGGKPPSEYLKDSFNNNQNLGDSLKAHLISPRIIQVLYPLLDYARDKGWSDSISLLNAQRLREFLSWAGSRTCEHSVGNGTSRVRKAKPSTAWPYYRALRRLFYWAVE